MLVRDVVENSLNNTEAKSTIVVVAHLMLYTVYFTGLYKRETNLNSEYASVTQRIQNVLIFKRCFLLLSLTLKFPFFLYISAR